MEKTFRGFLFHERCLFCKEIQCQTDSVRWVYKECHAIPAVEERPLRFLTIIFRGFLSSQMGVGCAETDHCPSSNASSVDFPAKSEATILLWLTLLPLTLSMAEDDNDCGTGDCNGSCGCHASFDCLPAGGFGYCRTVRVLTACGATGGAPASSSDEFASSRLSRFAAGLPVGMVVVVVARFPVLVDLRGLMGLANTLGAGSAVVVVAVEGAGLFDSPQVVGTSVRKMSGESSAEPARASYSSSGGLATWLSSRWPCRDCLVRCDMTGKARWVCNGEVISIDYRRIWVNWGSAG